MNTTSLWKIISKKPSTYPELLQDIEVDVAIIGGGITGMTAANQLIKSGMKVAILEAKEIGGVTTSSSTGNLYVAVQPFYQHVVSKFNLASAKMIAQSRKAAIDYIEQTITEKNIDCQFKRRSWYLYYHHHPKMDFDKEVETFKRMEIPIEYTNTLPFPVNFKKAAVIPNQARFNPLQYVISLAANLSQQGCMIFENTKVTALNEKETCVLQTNKAKITAKKVILATHTPIGIHSTQFFTAPYRSYVIAGTVADNKYPEGHLWNTDQPSYSICTHPEKGNEPQLLMIAGSHHKTGQGKDMLAHFEELKMYGRKEYKVADLSYEWSAQHYHAADDVPYIGLASRFSRHTYLATGFFADGLIYGTIAGILMADLITGKANPWHAVYNSTRLKPFASAAFVAKENSNVFLEYLSDYPIFSGNEYDDLKPGEGKIVEINREKCAVSRGEDNQLRIVSAVCTHMKCIVDWNNAEKTWDCPCHGSRFTPEGKVIEGPAIADLESK